MQGDQLEAALDRLADLGLSALMTRVVEPVFGAVLNLGEEDFNTEKGAHLLMADYWGLCKALAKAFEMPELAEKTASLFFAQAATRCTDWAETEMVEGKPRLKLRELKGLMAAATSAKGANEGLYNEQLISAAKARGLQKLNKEGKKAVDLAESPFVKLVKDWDKGFLWISHEPLREAWDSLIVNAENSGTMTVEGFRSFIQKCEDEAEKEDNAAISCAYIGRLMSFISRQPRGLELPKGIWAEGLQHLKAAYMDGREQAKRLHSENDKGLNDLNKKLLHQFRKMSNSLAERLRDDFLLGAFLRSQEGPLGEDAALGMVRFCKSMFIIEADAFSPKEAGAYRASAQAGANLLDLAGGAAALNLATAMELYDGFSSRPPAIPKEWGPWMNPETMSWLQEASLLKQESLSLEVEGVTFAKFMARLASSDATQERQTALAHWLDNAPLTLKKSDDSLKAAEMAQVMATGQQGSPLARSVSAKLATMGIAVPDLLGGFQDLMGVLEAFGISNQALARVDGAMAPALAALELEQLEGILAIGSEPLPPRHSSRL